MEKHSSGTLKINNIHQVRSKSITFIRYAQNQKIGKPNNLKVLVNNKVKGPKHDSQNLPNVVYAT